MSMDRCSQQITDIPNRVDKDFPLLNGVVQTVERSSVCVYVTSHVIKINQTTALFSMLS